MASKSILSTPDTASTRNSLYLMYQSIRKKNTLKVEGNVKAFKTANFGCSICYKNFTLLSSFLLHIYCHGDPLAIHNDIKNEKKKEHNVFKIEVDNELDWKGHVKPSELNKGKQESCIQVTHQQNTFIDTNTYLICYYCEKIFKNRNEIKKHLISHIMYFNNQKLIQCDICISKFESSFDKKEHYFRQHKRSSGFCKICKINFKSFTIRKQHELIFHSKNCLNCLTCKLGFESLEQIIEHNLQMHEDLWTSCSMCNEKFYTKLGKLRHILHSHLNSYNDTDIEALRVLQTIEENSLNNHNKINKHDQNKCSYCFKSFATQKLAILHEKRQHLSLAQDDVGYACPICKTFFEKREKGLKHARRVHNIRINKTKKKYLSSKKNKDKNMSSKDTTDNCYQCSQCDINFDSNNSFLKHCKLEHQDQSIIYKCGVCEKEMRTFRNLREHVEAVHEKRLQYWCDFCGKGSSRKSDIKVHIKVK